MPTWDLVPLIVKSNDDVRQEVFALQLLDLVRTVCHRAGVPVWLQSFRIIATSASTGLIEVVKDAISFDALKKREGYESLLDHFCRSFGVVSHVEQAQARAAAQGSSSGRSRPITAYGSEALLEKARRRFVRSLAGYSLFCYLFAVKDRHNGNILLDSRGHVIHIDFGFILGIAPGGKFSLETAPFKLTAEMADVLGGEHSILFSEFRMLLVQGFLALQVSLFLFMFHNPPLAVVVRFAMYSCLHVIFVHCLAGRCG